MSNNYPGNIPLQILRQLSNYVNNNLWFPYIHGAHKLSMKKKYWIIGQFSEDRGSAIIFIIYIYAYDSFDHNFKPDFNTGLVYEI